MIVWCNKGIVPIEAFTTFGMSAKPGSTNPIGKFGTGLKYGVAVVLRLGGEFRLFRGDEEYVFYTKEEDFRGKTFAKVRMKRRKGIFSKWRYEALPFTTELGKHWEPWMAVRELEANCRDEGGTSYTVDAPDDFIQAEADTTRIVVNCPEIDEAYYNLHEIFLPPKQLLYESPKVKIYEGGSKYMYYRGMRVTTLRKESLFTYELSHVVLTEDRTSMYTFADDDNIMSTLMECDIDWMIEKVVDNAEGHHEERFEWDRKAPKASTSWAPALSRSGLAGRFVSMRDNLHYGLAPDEKAKVSLTVAQWEEIMRSTVSSGIKAEVIKALEEGGWKNPELLKHVHQSIHDQQIFGEKQHGT